jgi:hypothetical protein
MGKLFTTHFTRAILPLLVLMLSSCMASSLVESDREVVFTQSTGRESVSVEQDSSLVYLKLTSPKCLSFSEKQEELAVTFSYGKPEPKGLTDHLGSLLGIVPSVLGVLL